MQTCKYVLLIVFSYFIQIVFKLNLVANRSFPRPCLYKKQFVIILFSNDVNK